MERSIVKKIKWEYQVRKFNDLELLDTLQTKLNKAGEHGWEICTIHSLQQGSIIIFKRPCGYVDTML